MQEIRCPNCGEVIQVDESDYAQIVQQVRDKEFENPFGFEDEILDKIYHDNFIRLYGNKPHELDREMLVSECKRLVSNYDLDVLQISNMNQIISEFSVKKR